MLWREAGQHSRARHYSTLPSPSWRWAHPSRTPQHDYPNDDHHYEDERVAHAMTSVDWRFDCSLEFMCIFSDLARRTLRERRRALTVAA